MGVSFLATELQRRSLPVYCWQLPAKLPLPPRQTPPCCMLATHTLVSMVFHMQLLLLSPVTLYQLLWEDIRLLLAPMETLLDLSMRFPALSLPLPLPNKSPVEM